MNLKTVSTSSIEPITLDEARDHLRVTPSEDSPTSHPDDDIIMLQLGAAREWCENYIKRSIAQKTLELALDSFPTNGKIELQMPPVISVMSVSYSDGDGNQQTVSSSDYVLNDYVDPPLLVLATGATWPTTDNSVNAIKIRYLTGYTLDFDSPDSNPFPKAIRAAILLLLGHWYANRELIGSPTVMQYAVESLLLPYRLRTSMA